VQLVVVDNQIATTKARCRLEVTEGLRRDTQRLEIHMDRLVDTVAVIPTAQAVHNNNLAMDLQDMAD
jgi:hypothetical protein